MTWLLSKPALTVAGLLIAGAIGSGWLAANNAKVRERDRADQNAVRFDSLALAKKVEIATKDSLYEIALQQATTARLRTDTVRRSITAASQSYARQRAAVNTTAPQRPGLSPDSIVVSREFVAAADSVMRLVPDLLAAGAREREAWQREREASQIRHQSMMTLDTLRVQEITALRIAVQAARPGVSDKAKWVAYGLAASAIICNTILDCSPRRTPPPAQIGARN